uniref:rRNA-processing protein UTP23 homolog n=1 Tax=Ditylenchus dipsaci TaxID=166011 RepID=A0A915EH12_9BILA
MKRASRILTFFRYNYGFQAPHTVLLDGTFCQAALQNKINLREQMPKYLAEEVHMVVTNCVLQELEKLGSTVYGALAICRQFTVAKCPHKPARTASECIKHLARRSKTKDHAKYFIGSQDDNLLLNLRDLGGIPLMSIKFNTILLEKPSNESLNGVQKSKDELEKVKELKEEVLGSELLKKRKRKGPKDPILCRARKPRWTRKLNSCQVRFRERLARRRMKLRLLKKRRTLAQLRGSGQGKGVKKPMNLKRVFR